MRHFHSRPVAPSMTALVLVLGLGLATSGTRSNRLGRRRHHHRRRRHPRCLRQGHAAHRDGTYKVHASRREGPGTAEVHARDIDIFYVLEGSATLVTGGRPVDAKTTAPDEVRAPSIEGGTSRAVAKGDVMIIHNGVPHWFKEVRGPFLYYTVKVPTAAGGSR